VAPNIRHPLGALDGIRVDPPKPIWRASHGSSATLSTASARSGL